MSIDVKKLRAEIKAVNAYRREGRAPAIPKDAWGSKNFAAANLAYRQEVERFCTGRATKLYSLMSHLRGRLHICKQWVPTYAADGGLRLEVKTLTHQEMLIQPLLAEFVLSSDAAAPQRAAT